MFLALFKQKITVFFFGSGYVIALITTIFRGLGIPRALLGALFGGICGLVIWVILIRILIRLISRKDLIAIFNLPMENYTNESSTEYSYEDNGDDEDDLSFEEIYASNPLADDETANTNDVEYYDSRDSVFDEDTSPDIARDNTGVSSIDPDGKFNFTVNGKTVRVTPQEGAQASRKVLVDDRDK